MHSRSLSEALAAVAPMAASQPRLIKFDSPVFAIAVAGGAAGELVLAAGGGGSARTGVLNQIVCTCVAIASSPSAPLAAPPSSPRHMQCSFGTPANATTPACLAKSSTDDKLVVQLAVSPDVREPPIFHGHNACPVQPCRLSYAGRPCCGRRRAQRAHLSRPAPRVSRCTRSRRSQRSSH